MKYPANLREDPLLVYAIACSSPALWQLELDALKCLASNKLIDADPATVVPGRLSTLEYHTLPTYLVQKEEYAKTIDDAPSRKILHTLKCARKAETGLEIKEEIKKATRGVRVEPAVECGGRGHVGMQAATESSYLQPEPELLALYSGERAVGSWRGTKKKEGGELIEAQDSLRRAKATL